MGTWGDAAAAAGTRSRKGPAASLRRGLSTLGRRRVGYENVTGVTCLKVTFDRLALVHPPPTGV